MSERKVTDGGRDLRAYLTKQGISVPSFCELHRLDRIQVQRILNGERWRRVTVDMGFAIELATGGRVKAARFRSHTAKAMPARAA